MSFHKTLLGILSVSVLLVLAAQAQSWPGVNLISPPNGAVVGSPVQIIANATSTRPITAMAVYVDHTRQYLNYAAYADARLRLNPGRHVVTVQAWDAAGAVFKREITITVVDAATGVSISRPLPGEQLASPVHIFANAYSYSSPIISLAVYVDYKRRYSLAGPGIADLLLPMAVGKHVITVVAWDTAGVIFKEDREVTVTSATPGVFIYTPQDTFSYTDTPPLQFIAAAQGEQRITAMAIYVDGMRRYLTYSDFLTTSLPLGLGKRFITVQAWDASGRVFKKSLTVTIAPRTE